MMDLREGFLKIFGYFCQKVDGFWQEMDHFWVTFDKKWTTFDRHSPVFLAAISWVCIVRNLLGLLTLPLGADIGRFVKGEDFWTLIFTVFLAIKFTEVSENFFTTNLTNHTNNFYNAGKMPAVLKAGGTPALQNKLPAVQRRGRARRPRYKARCRRYNKVLYILDEPTFLTRFFGSSRLKMVRKPLGNKR